MRFITCLLLAWGWPFAAGAQVVPAAAPRVAEVSSPPVLIASGKVKRNFYFSVGPGASYALLVAPLAERHSVRSLHLHFQPFGRDTAKMQVQVRIASVAATGSPADDDLLPAPVPFAASTMQALRQPLVLAWPAGQVPFPTGGFFVVIEGVGNAPDEYVAGLTRHSAHSYNGYYQIARRQQPGAPVRLLNRLSIPLLLSAKPFAPSASFWMRGGNQPGWQLAPDGKQVPLLEVAVD